MDSYTEDLLFYCEAPLDLDSGGMRITDGLWLAHFACLWGGPVLEIGVEYGNSTCYIDQGLHELVRWRDGNEGDALIYSVDIQDVRSYICHRQDFHLSRSVDYCPPRQCAWAFIDGDHTKAGVVADIKHCMGLGIERMVLHDARLGDPTDSENGQRGTDVLEAALEVFDDSWELNMIDTPCGLLVAEKCPSSPSD